VKIYVRVVQPAEKSFFQLICLARTIEFKAIFERWFYSADFALLMVGGEIPQ
jgi:hypothetical protein